MTLSVQPWQHRASTARGPWISHTVRRRDDDDVCRWPRSPPLLLDKFMLMVIIYTADVLSSYVVLSVERLPVLDDDW